MIFTKKTFFQIIIQHFFFQAQIKQISNYTNAHPNLYYIQGWR